jgi:competence protein CoiA
MLCALQKFTRRSVIADSQRKSDGPFTCLECSREVVLRTGSVRITHFAHRASSLCRYGAGETDAHRRCKKAIYEALLKEPGVKNVILEHPLETCRPDIFATIKNTRVAIEVQISTLSMDTIIRRTEEYARKGIYVLWLLQWTPYLDARRYSPKLWEKWIHAAYYGRVYYWIEGLTVVSYQFESHLTRVPGASWYSGIGEKMRSKTYTRRSRRFRSPARRGTFNLARDFVGESRIAWERNAFRIPAAKLWTYVNQTNSFGKTS